MGTPNSGKTSLFNALTGSRQKVANYPGVTVERKEGSSVTPWDARSRWSTSPAPTAARPQPGRGDHPRLRARQGVRRDRARPRAVRGRLDQLRLTIRLLLELKRIGRPLMLVLNMFDIATRRGITVDVERLAKELGVPVVTSIAVRKSGTADLLELTDEISAKPRRGAAGEQLARAQRRRAARHPARGRPHHRRLRQPASRPDTWTARIDAVVLHPVGGLIVLALILFVMFQAVFAWAQPLMDLLNNGFDALGEFVHATLPAGLLQSFLQNGVISGVGSVIVFLPQIIIIFLFILLLEDFGYMARAAFLMDRIMGGAGLHGRAFIPLLSSFACAIPGIMATRVIDNKRDRLTTILIAPLMTCSARIPVYTLIISAFIPARDVWGFINLQGLVMFGLYAAGIISALGVSFLIKFFMLRDYAPAPFMLELPDYKMPRAEIDRDRRLHARQNVPAARRHHDLLDDGADLVSGLVPAAAGGRHRARDRLQPGRDHRQVAGAAAGPRRLQLADRGRADPRHGGARGRGRSPRHRLCDRRRQGSGRADRPGAGDEMVARDRAVDAGLVRLRPAMRIHARRDPARDRKLDLDGRDLLLHAGAGLCREPSDLQRRGRVGGGLGPFGQKRENNPATPATELTAPVRS